MCLALLLGLLIGHASVAVHTATHLSGDSLHCDQCNSYGNAAEDLAAAHYPELPFYHEWYPAVRKLGHIAQRNVLHPQQRGPPASS